MKDESQRFQTNPSIQFRALLDGLREFGVGNLRRQIHKKTISSFQLLLKKQSQVREWRCDECCNVHGRASVLRETAKSRRIHSAASNRA